MLLLCLLFNSLLFIIIVVVPWKGVGCVRGEGKGPRGGVLVRSGIGVQGARRLMNT